MCEMLASFFLHIFLLHGTLCSRPLRRYHKLRSIMTYWIHNSTNTMTLFYNSIHVVYRTIPTSTTTLRSVQTICVHYMYVFYNAVLHYNATLYMYLLCYNSALLCYQLQVNTATQKYSDWVDLVIQNRTLVVMLSLWHRTTFLLSKLWLHVLVK